VDKEEAKEVLTREFRHLRRLTFGELKHFLHPASEVCVANSGKTYQVEINAVWDSAPGENLRVIVSVDDGGLRSLHPISDDFIIAPDGSFIGE
jgi:hypothetical protein